MMIKAYQLWGEDFSKDRCSAQRRRWVELHGWSECVGYVGDIEGSYLAFRQVDEDYRLPENWNRRPKRGKTRSNELRARRSS